MNALEVLTEKIQGDITARQSAIAGGAAKDFAEYREQVGVLRGLHHALAHVKDLSRAYLDGDDE